ncbi:MAG: AAA family ATPase [Cyanomargarita calcarea GSE-NOS-MK-12-04C]|jgi:predicted ATPase/GAF domain-containing protein|uniref:AAA family ATPase n=1 Tax=Cyanomargarita calcarea GSE-NOS-MK-12-04C TaxID=2839659 RepID=A0A951QNY5_9CYAN|nr:AAA family ATPase [Cyanomargarita calcarea GSE-NOS-MK-12-04C]
MVVVLDQLVQFPGYYFTEQIYLSTQTLVCRAIREEDQTSVVVKLMRNEYPSFSEIAQFRNQYLITKNLDLEGIVKPCSLENYRNGYALIMEDYGGISLKEWLTNFEIFSTNSLEEFFHITTQIVTTLDGLHRHNIIHKDIKPDNILINPITLELKIIDFSIASLLPKETKVITSPNLLEGTLAYISPEQTGRMNRGIDYRTDFYSLGVSLFELLTGELPFQSDDPMELVYCHIAKQPPKASEINPSIPAVLSEIISKLMAKNAEDRYHSALGLKYDLETCKQQWQDTGKILPFELATRDISERFLIPEKLYGRQHEVKTLLAAFERVVQGKTEMILVAGFSGIGKTAIVNEIHKPIAQQRSYFIKGKFDQFQHDIPLSGLVQAFRDLIGQLLGETDAEIQQWKKKILSALGEQAQIVIDLIPELELIIDKQPPIVELSGGAAQNRFNLLFEKFTQVFAVKEHPLVIFLDDLQWADSASLKFIQLLMTKTSAVKINSSLSYPLLGEALHTVEVETERGLLLIGAYRDNEISKAHPLHSTLKEIQQTAAAISRITLAPLNQSNLNSLIADTLHCEESLAIPLSQMVFAKTKGNPFFSNQFLKSLHNDKLIQFSFDVGHWEYDIRQIKSLALTDDVVEFMALQIQKLPKYTQRVLKLAACIGNQFDLKMLSIVLEKSVVDTASDLWPTLHDGLVLPQTEVYNSFSEDSDTQPSRNRNFQIPKYKFVHDRVQQAAYSLIPEEEKQSTHLKIGQLLLSKIPIVEREENIFELVNQLNIAVELIADLAERDELARMNLIAGRKALASTAYRAAVKYLTIAIQLLASDSWEVNYYLTLALYETAAEAAYLSGDFEQTEHFVEVVLLQAKTLLEKVKVYEVKIQAYGAQGKAVEAVNTALSFVKLLGVEFPDNPSQSDVQFQLQKTTANLSNRSVEGLIDLPKMTEAQPLAVMLILSSAITLAYQVAPNLFLLIVLKQVNLSLQYGNAPLSAFVYVVYGFILCGVLGEIESGYEFGKLALNLLPQFDTKEVKAKIIQTFNAHIRYWKEPARQILRPLLDAYSIGLEIGDLEFAALSLNAYCYSSYFIGRELTEIKHEMASYSHIMNQIKQERVFYRNEIYRQAVSNLLGYVEKPDLLVGEVYNEEKMLPLHLESNDVCALFYLYSCKLQLSYLFADYFQAIENAAKTEKYLDGGIGQIVFPQYHFYDSLAQLAVYPDAEESKQKQILHKVTANQQKMQKWAHHAPMNYLHKYYLVEAEQHRVLSNNTEAMELYDCAISLAKENAYIHEEALANELAAKFYLEWGKEKIAQTYLTDAYYGYVRWGAKAKVDDLQKCYAQLLSPILLQEQLNLHPIQKNSSSNKIFLSSISNPQTVIGSRTTISDSLDLAAVIKASQALSGEIEIEQLLSTLMAVVMENAGASKCALLLKESDNLDLTVTVVSSSSTCKPTTEFPSTRLESSNDVPISLINYVKRTQGILVIDNAMAEATCFSDRYFVHHKAKSVLCILIVNQGKFIGILYLENNLTTGAFTRDRVELIKLITTQAAISLENAMLYKNLTVANDELQEYNHNLEDKNDPTAAFTHLRGYILGAKSIAFYIHPQNSIPI